MLELMAAYWTLAGGASPLAQPHVSPIDFVEKVKAAARAGFRGLGFWHTDLKHLLNRWSAQELRRILDDHGIAHVEMEFLTGWFAEGAERAESDRYRQLLLETGGVLGARHLKIGDLSQRPIPPGYVVECFAEICREAAREGMQVGIELMPFSAFNSLPELLQLVESADQPNGGLLLDFWHLQKLDIAACSIARIDPRKIVAIELSDGFIRSMPDLVREATERRQLCGEGEWDVRAFVRDVTQMGYEGLWSVEIMSEELRRVPIAQMAQRAFDTTTAQFATPPTLAIK